MKTTLFMVTALVSTLVVQESVKAHSGMDGFRIGGQVGYALTGTKVSIKRINCQNCGDSSDVAGRGLVGGLTVDMSTFLRESHILQGLEFAANFGQFSGRKSVQGTIYGSAQSNLTTKVGFQQAYDMSYKFGYMVGHAFLPYAKVGATWARWKIKSVSNQLGVGSSNTGKFGLVVGFGLEFPLVEYFSQDFENTFLAVEVNTRQYGHTSHNIINNTDQVLRTVKVTPSLNTFMFRISHKIE